MAAFLKTLDLPEASKIGILSKNCAHWIMSDLAIMMSGHISVPLYPNLNSSTLAKILEHSETRVLFVGKLDNYSEMKSEYHQKFNVLLILFIVRIILNGMI